MSRTSEIVLAHFDDAAVVKRTRAWLEAFVADLYEALPDESAGRTLLSAARAATQEACEE